MAKELDGKLIWIATQVLAVILFLGVGLAAYFFVFQGEMKKYDEGGPLNIKTKEDALATRQAYKKELERLYTLYQENVGNENDNVNEVIPDAKHLPPIYAMLDAIATSQGIALQSVDVTFPPENTKNPSPLKEIIISVKATNVGYSNLKGFLDALEKNKRLTDVSLLEYDSKAKFLNLNVKMYYLGEKKVVAKTK